jgi:hypothetical protein
MGNKTIRAFLCLLLIAAVFACIGCAGRNAGKNNQGSTATATPTPAPAATPTAAPAASPTPAPTVSPGDTGAGQGNNTTTLSTDDVYISGGDEQYEFPEDALPTPQQPE